MAIHQFVVTCDTGKPDVGTVGYYLSWLRNALTGPFAHLVTRNFVVDIKTVEQDEIGGLEFKPPTIELSDEDLEQIFMLIDDEYGDDLHIRDRIAAHFGWPNAVAFMMRRKGDPLYQSG